jgi:hypothetical protein
VLRRRRRMMRTREVEGDGAVLAIDRTVEREVARGEGFCGKELGRSYFGISETKKGNEPATGNIWAAWLERNTLAHLFFFEFGSLHLWRGRSPFSVKVMVELSFDIL